MLQLHQHRDRLSGKKIEGNWRKKIDRRYTRRCNRPVLNGEHCDYVLRPDRGAFDRVDRDYPMVREAMAFQHGVQSPRFKTLDLPFSHPTDHRYCFGHLSSLLYFQLSGGEYPEGICE